MTARATRERLPKHRKGNITHFHIGELSGFVTIGEYDDGRPGEVFIEVAKTGSMMRGLIDALAIMVSHALQYGLDVEVVVDALKGREFEPAGMTDDDEIPVVKSLVDWLARRLELDYMQVEGDTIDAGEPG